MCDKSPAHPFHLWGHKMNHPKLLRWQATPLGVVSLLGILMFASVYGFMLLLRADLLPGLHLHVQHSTWDIVGGVVALTLTVAPALYYLVFRVTRASNARFRQANAAMLDAMIITDLRDRIAEWNPAAERMFQYTRAEALGQPMHQLIVPERYHETAARGLAHFRETGNGPLHGMVTEVAARRKDGSEFPAELSTSSSQRGAEHYVFRVVKDITERRNSDQKILRQNQFYAALSQCNGTMVHCTSEQELLEAICQIGVTQGGMTMAWVGQVDPDTRLFQAVASAGIQAEEVLQATISVDPDSPLGGGLVSQAFREGQPVWCEDYQHDPRTAPWHAWSARFNVTAAAALPLRCNDVTARILLLFADKAAAFDPETRGLLVQMAEDISYALDNLSHQAARQFALSELRDSEERFRGLVEQSLAGVYLLQHGRFVYVNPHMAEILGYADAGELIGVELQSLVVEKDRDRMAELVRRRSMGEKGQFSYNFTAVRRDGSLVEIGVNSSRAMHQSQPASIGLAQDITDTVQAEELTQRHLHELEAAFLGTVQVATHLSEMRDAYTQGHANGVGEIAAAIGAELGFDAKRQQGLRVAGSLHDVGKISIPLETLTKQGPLKSMEWEVIRQHPQIGYDILQDIDLPWPVAMVAHQHHERMDGSGYPQGLQGDAIIMEARIVMVADVVESMASRRPYREGLGIIRALAEIERGRGTVYDADVVDACLRLFREKGYAVPGSSLSVPEEGGADDTTAVGLTMA
jgi:PAS domain S-box-containing protein